MRSNEQMAGNNGKEKIQEGLGRKMEAELTKQEHKNRPPNHAEKGPGLRLACTQTSNTGDLEIQG
jgi:hypothetical protein